MDLTTLPLLLPKLVYGVMLASLLAIVFVPFFPGVAVIAVSLLLYIGYSSYVAHAFVGLDPIVAGFVLVFALAGIFSSWWTEKLEVRFTYTSQEVAAGMLIGSLAFGMIFKTMFWFMLGMLIGGVAMEVRRGRPFPEALRQGLAAIYSSLGPRGFQLLMAMLIIDTSVPLGAHLMLMRGWGL